MNGTPCASARLTSLAKPVAKTTINKPKANHNARRPSTSPLMTRVRMRRRRIDHLRQHAGAREGDLQRDQLHREEQHDGRAEAPAPDHRDAHQREQRDQHVDAEDQHAHLVDLAAAGQAPRPVRRQQQAVEEQEQLHHRRVAAIDRIVDRRAAQPLAKRLEGVHGFGPGGENMVIIQ